MVKKTEVSEKLKLNKEDGKKILKGFGIAMGGAAAAFGLNMIPQIDWGSYAYIVIPVASVVLNTVIKVLRGK